LKHGYAEWAVVEAVTCFILIATERCTNMEMFGCLELTEELPRYEKLPDTEMFITRNMWHYMYILTKSCDQLLLA